MQKRKNDCVNEQIKNINLEKIKFKIGWKIKQNIKVKDILYCTIEKLLILEHQKNEKNSVSKAREKNLSLNRNHNKDILLYIRAFIGSTLDEFFKTRVIYLFQDIYSKKRRKKIDLKKYGLPGMFVKMPKYLKSFNKLKERNKKFEQKIISMNKIVINNFLEVETRKNYFQIIRKK